MTTPPSTSTRFALLGTCVDPAVVGEYPQIQTPGRGEFWDIEVRARSRLIWESHRAASPPDLGTVALHPRARLTDRVSCIPLGGNGLLLSDRAASVFRRHPLAMHAFCPIGLLAGGTEYRYQWLHIGYADSSWERSSADLIAHYGELDERVPFASLDAFSQYQSETTLPLVRLVVPSEYTDAAAVFGPVILQRSGRRVRDWLVSRGLADSIEAEQLTGFNVEPSKTIISQDELLVDTSTP